MSSAYEVRFDPKALAELRKLDRISQERITSFLFENVHGKDKPCQFGKALTGEKIKMWSYRTGAYRVLCHIDDAEKVVKVLRIGHRKDIYR